MSITINNKSALNSVMNNCSNDPDANETNILFWDQLALIGAIINDAPNGSNILLARLVLLASKGNFIARTVNHPTGEQWDKKYLAAAFCHGCRIRLEYTETKTGEFFNELKKNVNLPRRLFSSHGLEYKDNQFVETGNYSPFGRQQYGINVAMYGNGSNHPQKNTEVFSEGNNGHLLLLHKTAPAENKAGAILFGIEGSAPMRSNVEGDLHGPNAKPAKIGVSGVGSKFPEQAKAFIGSGLTHKMNSLIIDNIKTTDIQKLTVLSKNNLKYQAVSAILNRPKLTPEEYLIICAEFEKNQLYHSTPKTKSIWQRMGDWFSNNPWKATAYILGGIIAVGAAVGALILTGGAAAIPLGLLAVHYGLPTVAAIVGTGATGVVTAAAVQKIKTTKQLSPAESQLNFSPIPNTSENPKFANNNLFFPSPSNNVILKPTQTTPLEEKNIPHCAVAG